MSTIGTNKNRRKEVESPKKKLEIKYCLAMKIIGAEIFESDKSRNKTTKKHTIASLIRRQITANAYE